MGAPKNRVNQFISDMLDQYGLTVDAKEIAELLHCTIKTAKAWSERNDLQGVGRQYVFSTREVAKAMIETGGAV